METISVHDLIFDRTLNPRRQAVDMEVVEYYASIFKEVVWPPILVHQGTNKLIDGWHRVEAAKRAGVYSLPVQWLDAKEDELFALAIKANLAHGVKLSKEERFLAIIRLMREAWTPERIAGVLGCSMGMIGRTEQAEDLRIKFKVADNPAQHLPVESLFEVTKLPPEFQDEVAELAAEVEADPTDVRRAVRAIKKGEVEETEKIRRVMTDPEYAKSLQKEAPTLDDGNWMMNFATLIDRMETQSFTITPVERSAAVNLFRRLRSWADKQLSLLGGQGDGE